MSYVIEQRIKGKVYLYEVEAYWDKDKKQARQRRKYLGKKDEATGEIRTPRKAPEPKSTKEYGGVYVLHELAQETGLLKLLKSSFTKEDYERLLAYAYYKILTQGATYLFDEWTEDNHLPFELRDTSSSGMSRWMKHLGEREGERALFLKRWIKHHKTDEAVWLDITSLSAYSTQNNWLEWGYNRDGEALPQINLGMILGALSKTPLSYEIYPGSISDVSTLKNVALRQKAWSTKVKTFIMDRGFYSASNIREMHGAGLHFIVPLPSSVKQASVIFNDTKAELDSPRASFSFEGTPLFAATRSYELDGIPLHATVFFDPERYAQESQRFYKRLHELEGVIQGGTFFTIEQVEEALESAWKGSSRYVTITLTEQRASLARKRNAISLRINRMGKMILISDQKIEASSLLSWYRQKDYLEKSFDVLKNELDEKRLRIHSALAMQGKMFLNFIAIILYSTLSHKIQASQLTEHYTTPEALAILKKLRVVSLSNHKSFLTEISKKQRQIFQALSFKSPLLS